MDLFYALSHIGFHSFYPQFSTLQQLSTFHLLFAYWGSLCVFTTHTQQSTDQGIRFRVPFFGGSWPGPRSVGVPLGHVAFPFKLFYYLSFIIRSMSRAHDGKQRQGIVRV